MLFGIRPTSALRLLAVAATLATAVGFGTAPASAEEKVVRIGTEGAYPPFNEVDADGNLKGFDIDIAKALCEKMAVKCEFIAQDWDGIIPALKAKKYDAIVASMSITEDRKKEVDFTDKYYNTPSQFIAAKGTDVGQATPADFKGKTLGAQSSTIQANMLEGMYKESTVKLYGTVDELYADLSAGRVDAAFVDKLVSAEWLGTDAGKGFDFVGPAMMEPTEYLGDGVGIAVRKGDDELRLALNKAIAEILADGTYKAINDKYFPFSIY